MITTAKGFKKPEDGDNADLKVFVGENVDNLETELDNKVDKDANGKVASTDLPIASDTDLGAVKVGSGLSIDANGVLTATGGGTATADPNTFPANLYAPFVYTGLNVAVSGTSLDTITVSYGVAYLKQADETLKKVVSYQTDFVSALANATYYLDLNPDGTMSWNTSHSTVADYLPIAEVTTDGVTNILDITDVAVRSAEMLPLSQASVKAPINGGIQFGNFEIKFNSATNSLDFVYIG